MLLLDVWREACRHAGVTEAVAGIAAALPPELPPAALVLRRLGPGRLDTVATGNAGEAEPPPRTELSPEQEAELEAWCRAGRIARHRAEAVPPPLDLAVPAGMSGDLVVGPLLDPRGAPIGVAVLAARSFGAVHEGALQRLLEPLSALLANHIRRREVEGERAAVEAERDSLRERLARGELSPGVMGRVAGLGAVLERVRQVAAAEVPVLLLGEPGSGREAVAREIHRLSARARRPLLRVPCGPRAEAALFGEEGALERAEGGTLFVEEIGALPLEAQGRLLEVLREGCFQRRGRPVQADVRLVAAAARDPLALVQEGRFLEELWYRVGVFPIRIPPLREHPEDVGVLAAHFAHAAGVRATGTPLVPDAEELRLLAGYPWPGNVAELAAVVQRAAVLGAGTRLEVAAALGAARPGRPPTPASAPVTTLDDAIARHVEAALAATQGRIEGAGGAAALLGINPHTLRSRMRKLGIQWSRYRTRESA